MNQTAAPEFMLDAALRETFREYPPAPECLNCARSRHNSIVRFRTICFELILKTAPGFTAANMRRSGFRVLSNRFREHWHDLG